MSDPNNEQTNFSQPGESDLEDTKPRRIAAKPEEPVATDAHVAATTPIPIGGTGAEASEPGLDQTRPTLLGQLDEDIAHGYEHTIPPPAGFGLEADPPAAEDHPGEPVSQTLPTQPLAFEGEQLAEGLPPVVPPAERLPGKKMVRKKKARRRGFPRRVMIPVLGAIAIVLVAVLSAAGGYFSGIDQRQSAQKTQWASEADHQFQLGLEQMAAGNYYRARQHFEGVIQMNPAYPGATEKLAEALAYLNATATPTLMPTATITPTPDTRANEDLFNQAQQAILNKDWNAAVDALLSLRSNDASYRAIEIDGMLFLALRNRGKDKIVGADLESGIYDLGLAAKFGPLDAEAKGLQDWAQLYITGASFWEIDWAQVVQYFSQVAPSMPNLMDASRMTASERYRLGLFNYGNQLASQGQFCQAAQQYQLSLQIAQNAEVQAAYEQAVKGCEGGGAQGTPKPGGGGGGKKKTPTVEPPGPPPAGP